MDSPLLGPAAVLLPVLAATVVDFRTHRIPNILTAGFALLILCLRGVDGGWSGLAQGMAGWLGALAVFLPLYGARWMGGGDVKLMAAVGAYFGWPEGLLAAAWTLLFGAVGGLLILARHGGLASLAARYGAMARGMLCTGEVLYVPPRPDEEANLHFPYASAIALGTLAELYRAGALEPWLRTLGAAVHGP